MSIISSMGKEVKSVRLADQIASNWYKQLPNTDWLKSSDDDRESSEEWRKIDKRYKDNLAEISGIVNTLKKASISFINLGMEVAEQENKLIGKPLNFIAKYKEKRELSSYVLYDSKSSIITKIELHEKQPENLIFYKKKEKLKFILKKEDFDEDITKHLDQTTIVPADFVFTCVDDSEVATIYNGILIAHKKGNTILRMSNQGYIFSYEIIVS